MKKTALIIFLLAFIPLAAALGSQYLGGLHPCEYCIYQRIPYAVIIGLLIISLITKFEIKRVIYALLFFATAALGFYHAGGELGYWKIASDCVADLDFYNLMNSLKEAAVVRCDDVQFEFLNISMAGWNFLYGLVASIITLKIR